MSTTTPSLDLNFNFNIPTPRLYISYLNPSSPSHCDLTVSLLHGAASMKHKAFSHMLVPDRATAQHFLVSGNERLARTGYGRYLISLKPATDNDNIPFSARQLELDPIGVVTMQLNRHPSDQCPTIPDLGFHVLEKYLGKGYATEAALALMKYYREEKGVMAFAGLTDMENEKAKRMLLRLGFVDRGQRSIKGVVNGGKPTVLSVWTLGVGEGEEVLEGVGL